MITSVRAPLKAEAIVPEKLPKKVTRKPPSKLKIRAIQNTTQKLLKTMETNYGEKNVKFYLQSAINTSSSKRRKFFYDTEKSGSESDTENLDVLAVVDIHDDDRVLKAITNLPRKYLVYGYEDQSTIISLFEIVKGVVMEHDYALPDIVASTTTAKILSENKYYCAVEARTILRRYLSKDKKKKKSGPKIENISESEVWGNLMLCMFENGPNQVRQNLDNLICFKLHTFLFK